MALDLYQPCPCHQKRKLKFCCGKDVVARISKAIELMEGEQKRKAMSYLDESIKKFGHKDCLSTMRFGAAMDSGDIPTATETADGYATENGPTSVGYSMQAILSLENDQVDQSIDFLQSALEADNQLANLFEDALLTLVFRLLAQQDLQAARAHAYMLLHITAEKKDLATAVIKRCQLGDAPLILKNEWPLTSPTADQPWAKKAAQAIHWAENWQWRKSLTLFLELAEEFPLEASLWKNAAILASHLNNKNTSAEAWRSYARCEGVSDEHAAEAEQTAIVLSDWEGFEYESIPKFKILLNDAEQAQIELEKDPRTYNNPDLVAAFQEGRPEIIKACYQIHDRPLLNSVDQIESFQDIPCGVGFLILFGKTTDHPAFIEIVGQNVPSWHEFFDDLLGWNGVDSNTKDDSQLAPELIPIIHDRAQWTWHTPTGVSDTQFSQWLEDCWTWTLENRIINLPCQQLEGKTIEQAASTPSLKNKVVAILNVLSTSNDQHFDREDGVNRLKEKLGISLGEKLEPETVRLENLSLDQFARLDFSKMPLDMLAWAFDVAGKVVNIKAIKAISSVVTDRLKENEDEVTSIFPVFKVFQILAKFAFQRSEVERNMELANKYFPEDASLQMQADWLMSNFELCVTRRMFDSAIQYLQKASEVCKQDEELHLEFVKTCSRLGIHPGSPLTSIKNDPAKDSGLILDPSQVTADAGTSQASSRPKSELWIPGQ